MRPFFARLGLGLLLTATAGPQLSAQVTLLKDTVVDKRGTTLSTKGKFGIAINGLSFQNQAVTSFKGYQYVIYYAATAPNASHVALARRKLPEGEWQVLDLEDSKFAGSDAHNVVSMGICPADGSLHIAYNHHGSPLHYRMSVPGIATDPEHAKWDPSIFQPETSQLVAGQPVTKVTYPDFERTPEGNLQLFVRYGGSGDGSWWVWNYDGATHLWTKGWEYDNGLVGVYDDKEGDKPTGHRCEYPNGWTYGPGGKLHSTFVWREDNKGGSGSNHDICYVYSEDGGVSWKNNAGEVVGDQKNKELFNITSPGLVVVPHSQWDSLINTQGQAVDSAGHIHTFMYHLDPAKGTPAPKVTWQIDLCSYFHNWRDDAGKWHENVLATGVGTRAKLFFDKHDNAYAVFTNSSKDKPERTHALFITDQQLVVAMATKAAQWADWKVVLTLPGPYVNEVQGDIARLESDGILSIFAQESPTANLQPTKVHILDFTLAP